MNDRRWHRVLPSGDLDTGELVPVSAGGSPVLVGRLSHGKPVAFATRCPHQDTDLTEAGALWEDKLRCHQHQYVYDPSSGENVFPARTAPRQNLWRLKPRYLPTYPVEEHDGWIWVAEEPNPPPTAYDPATEEPPFWAGPPSLG